jgi:hypothetical protein
MDTRCRPRQKPAPNERPEKRGGLLFACFVVLAVLLTVAWFAALVVLGFALFAAVA